MGSRPQDVSSRWALDSYQRPQHSERSAPATSRFNRWSETPAWVSGGRSRPERTEEDWSGLKAPQWDKETLPSFKKDFYRETPECAKITASDVKAFLDSNRITVTGDNIPKPILSFTEGNLPDYMTRALTGAGFTAPTPIQSQGWPLVLKGNDLIGIAQTGSGKTLTFLLPALIHINDQARLQRGDGPIALVLAPTRELARQISEECKRFGRITNISNICVYGGASRQFQQRDLERGTHIIIATPGRLLDFLDARVTNMKRVTFLVLDEADRMLDMGFEPQIRKILEQIRPDRQTLMFSATWPREVQSLARDFTRSAVQVQIGSVNLTANIDICQQIEFVEESQKLMALERILENVLRSPKSKVVIFAETKRNCERLGEELRQRKMPVEALHGDKTQRERDAIIRAFRSGQCQVLVATDVASRGLDVKDIEYVINFDFPSQIEDYIHRIGRTGRAGAKGTAITFFTFKDSRSAKDLVKILKETKQDIPQMLIDVAASHAYGGGYSRNSRWRGDNRSRTPRFRRPDNRY